MNANSDDRLFDDNYEAETPREYNAIGKRSFVDMPTRRYPPGSYGMSLIPVPVSNTFRVPPIRFHKRGTIQ